MCDSVSSTKNFLSIRPKQYLSQKEFFIELTFRKSIKQMQKLLINRIHRSIYSFYHTIRIIIRSDFFK